MMSETTDKPFSGPAERNSAPILDVLRNELANASKVLEIGSGTGQHAACFAKELPFLQWQTSDRDENHDGIHAWISETGLTNLLPPLSLDVLTAELPAESCDAVYSSNTAHIMSIEAVQRMFAIVATVLQDNGLFCLYGPFRQNGEFNTSSNSEFHKSLRSRNPEMGIRHLEALHEFAREQGLARVRLYTMPANNHLAIWRKAMQ
jgi:cyclopropane fatty-acyl-phospholipid synthase-like methyltransferase